MFDYSISHISFSLKYDKTAQTAYKTSSQYKPECVFILHHAVMNVHRLFESNTLKGVGLNEGRELNTSAPQSVIIGRESALYDTTRGKTFPCVCVCVLGGGDHFNGQSVCALVNPHCVTHTLLMCVYSLSA